MLRTAALLVGFLIPFAAASLVSAETKVTLEKTHLCCPSCVKAVGKAVDGIPGTKAVCDQKAGTVTITAPDEEAGQKAINALSAAGFYGKSTGATIKDDSGAPAGSVKTLTLTTHNCCKKCATAINKVIASVEGAKGEAMPKDDTFTVTGDFDAGKLVQAFNDAGFSVKASTK
jgi:copper chaperone CopZ